MGQHSPSAAFIDTLSTIVGARNVLTDRSATARFATGYRFGGGPVEAVVRPGTLVEMWQVVQALVAADRIIIVQAANTGLTGGSTPDGNYDRPVVIVATMRLNGIHVLDGGGQVVCLPGATLDALEHRLKPLGREPHSVIGSSCIGASVIGGVCNNSGGALVQRGPAYTELALYARIDQGRISLVNNLGIALGDHPESILQRLGDGAFDDDDIDRTSNRAASDHSYCDHVRDIDASSPARFNADPSRLFEVSGSAGRVIVFAARLDTFARPETTQTFYIGTNEPVEFTELRRALLRELQHLPISAEYIHRDAFDCAARYGKDVFLAIRWLGTRRLPALFAAKARFDALAKRLGIFPADSADRCLQTLASLLPNHLPTRMRDYRRQFAHHLILHTGDEGIDEARALLAARFPTPSGAFFECDARESRSAFLHRFATAGAAVRYRAVHSRDVEGIVALDIALRRDDPIWFETLPADLAAPIVKALYYGHFLCHVFHQDYLVAKGHDPIALEHRMWALLDARGAEYPAEHNVGHLYPAKAALVDHYRALDPQNSVNPGIGKTSRAKGWA